MTENKNPEDDRKKSPRLVSDLGRGTLCGLTGPNDRVCRLAFPLLKHRA